MTELRLYNTLTRQKEPFTPIDPSNVRMYVCGPTVYDFAHIGNARPAIVFDVLFRLLRHLYGEQHVTYVRNITDVDDKINARALRDYGERISKGELSLNDAIRQVTESTAKQYHEDVAALGCLKPTVEPRATEHIDGMVAMIQRLLDEGHAYLATGGEGHEVLFDVASMPDYGALSKRRLEDQQAGARVSVEGHKKNPADFVLWKESSADEPGWEGSFTAGGETVAIHGRPGWHIECSVMSEAHLGETFDIHGGGLDLIFPHHENEIAQSRCAHHGAPMANYWMHNGFVQVEGRKMAKSEGNFVTIHDLLHTEKFGGRKWPGEVLRLAMLMTHYREPIDFSLKRLEEAQTELASWSVMVKEYRDEIAPNTSEGILSALCDDMNFPSVLAELRKLWKELRSPDASEAGTRHVMSKFLGGLELVGIDPVAVGRFVEEQSPLDRNVAARLTALVQARVEARESKDWAKADQLREQIKELGFSIRDEKDEAGNIVPRLEPLR